MIDLNDLSLAELKKLQKDVAKAIDSFADREKKAVRAKLEAVARENGFELADILEAAPIKTRKAVAPKYANPQDPAETWSGRGRKPRWVVAALDSGKSLSDLHIA
jgi:DNA-binding protein H-NS